MPERKTRERSPGGRENNGWGGARPGAGRKRTEEKGETGGKVVSAYLSAEDIAYLEKWGSGGTVALRSLIERARKFWPNGI